MLLPTGDAPTTSELSTITLSIKVRLILEVWQYVFLFSYTLEHSMSKQTLPIDILLDTPSKRNRVL